MMYVDFSAVRETDLVSLVRDDLTEIAQNSVFQTPDEFVPESLTLSVRGVSRSLGANNDFEITGPDEIKINCHVDFYDNIVVTYLKR